MSFVYPQPSPIDLAAHFGDADESSHDDLESKFETNREELLARVADDIQLRKPPGRIVDVGCATGIFLARFLADAWPQWEEEARHFVQGDLVAIRDQMVTTVRESQPSEVFLATLR